MLGGGSNEKCPLVSYFFAWFPLVELTVKFQNLWGRSLAGGAASLGRAWRSTVWPQLHSFFSCPPHPAFLYGDEIGALCFLCLPACTLALFSRDGPLPLELQEKIKPFFPTLFWPRYLSQQQKKKITNPPESGQTHFCYFSPSASQLTHGGYVTQGYLTHGLSVILMFTHKCHSLSYSRYASHFNGVR